MANLWKLRAALLCPLLLVAGASAAEHRVQNLRQFNDAVDAAQPGDAIVLADGAWRDVDLLFDCLGTADAPITLRAETQGRVTISGHSRLRIGGDYLVASGLLFRAGHFNPAAIEFRRDSKRHASHCLLTDCAIVAYNPAQGGEESKWISLYGHHNRVEHCYLGHKRSGGATLVVWLDGAPAEHRIAFNRFGPRPSLGKNGGETIRIGDSATAQTAARCVVEYNLFEECDGEVEIISSKSCENIFRCNTFRACSGALTLRHGNRCLVEGNFFFGERKRGSGGVRVIGEDHRVLNNYFENLAGDGTRAALSLQQGQSEARPEGHQPVRRAVVAFNTFVDCKRSLVLGVADDDEPADTPPDGCIVANNLLLGDRGPLIEIVHEPRDCTWLGNLAGGEEPVVAREGVEQVDGKELLTGQRDAPWRLVERSAAIDAAHSGALEAVLIDIDGQPRGNQADAGCDERSSAEVTRRPMTKDDAGPRWSVEP